MGGTVTLETCVSSFVSNQGGDGSAGRGGVPPSVARWRWRHQPAALGDNRRRRETKTRWPEVCQHPLEGGMGGGVRGGWGGVGRK